MQRRSYRAPLIIALAVVLGMCLGVAFDFDRRATGFWPSNAPATKLLQLIDYIESDYVDAVAADSIVDLTVNRLLEQLDPHSTYISSQLYPSIEDDMRGDFVGVGINFYLYQDTIAVIRSVIDGPAAAAGIASGDRILTADGRPLFGAHADRDSVAQWIRGPVKTPVRLEVFRPSADSLFVVDVMRERIPLASVEGGQMLRPGIGYLKINRFTETTEDEFILKLKDLTAQQMDTVILDLRDNPGGYVGSALGILDQFMPSGTLLLTTKNKQGRKRNSYAERRGLFEKGALYVLLNEQSASSAEIVAGALQDQDRAIIVGRRSFGKGLVQREMGFGDVSAVRLTVARYYTPSGRSIQRPYGTDRSAYLEDIEARIARGEMQDSSLMPQPDSLTFVTSNGKRVYGGGGIAPDLFVPLPTSIEDQTLRYLNRSGLMSYVVFDYLENHRSEFAEMTAHEFIEHYKTSSDLLEKFMDDAQLKASGMSMTNQEAQLLSLLKAELADQVYGPQYALQLLLQADPMIDKVFAH